MKLWISKYITPFKWLLQFSLFTLGWGLKCYECDSTEEPDCGYVFNNVFEPKVCTSEETTCAIQRQDERYDQVFAILRGCYKPGLLPGLNSSLGCRYWYNEEERYDALYCFCDTDGCNSATYLTVSPLFYVICISCAVWHLTGHWQRLLT